MLKNGIQLHVVKLVMQIVDYIDVLLIFSVHHAQNNEKRTCIHLVLPFFGLRVAQKEFL